MKYVYYTYKFFFEDAFLIIDFEDLLLVESRDYF